MRFLFTFIDNLAINITALEKNAARFGKRCIGIVFKSRSGFQPDNPDEIGIYRSICVKIAFLP